MLNYLGINRDHFIGISTKEIEKIVIEKTGKDMKQVLFELFVVKEESIEEISELFACSNTTIRQKIKEYGFVRAIQKKNKPKKLRINNKNVKRESKNKLNIYKNENLNPKKIEVDRVYNKTPKTIEIETGRIFVDIVQEYIDKGYSPSQIAKKLKLANQTNIKQALKKLEYSKQETMFPNVFGRGKSLINSEKTFKELTGMSLIEFLKIKYVDEGLSTHAIAPFFGTDAGTILTKLKAYGLNRNLSEARKLLVEKGGINYSQIHTKRTITVEKDNMESKNQKLAAELFHIHFAEVLAKHQNLEAVIGFNNWFILKNKEVDIPIVIIDGKKNKVYKFAVEYQAEHTHSSVERIQSDKEKEDSLRSSDWLYFTIWDSPYYRVIESRVIEIIESIMSKIE